MNKSSIDVYIRGTYGDYEMYAKTADGITVKVPLPGIGPFSWSNGTCGEAQHRCSEALTASGLHGMRDWSYCFTWAD